MWNCSVGKKCLETQLIKILNQNKRLQKSALHLRKLRSPSPVQLSFPERSGFKTSDGWWVPVASCGVCSEVKCGDGRYEFTYCLLSFLKTHTGTVSQAQIRLATSNADPVSYYRSKRHVFSVFKIRLFSILPNVLPNTRSKLSDSNHSFFRE